MSEPTPRTAIIVPLELPAALERIRQAGEPMATLGVPAHVTLLFPFMPRDAVDGAVLERVSAIIARRPRFDVVFRDVRRFGTPGGSGAGVLWLAPEPARPFAQLTEAFVEAFPDYPPYEGAHEVVIHHLTMADGPAKRFDALETAIRGHLPVRRRVDAAALLVEDVAGRWSVEDRFELG